MKKVFFIAVVLFGVTTANAQTNGKTDVIDTLETCSKLAKNKLTLPKNITEDMSIQQNNRGTSKATLVFTFNKNLTESEIELVKNYAYYYYQAKQPKETMFNSAAPDIDNKKNKCVITFYKL